MKIKEGRALIISIILHALLLMTVYIFQGMVFPYLRLYGLVPILLPVAATGVAVYEGRVAGGVTGLFAGILCDVSFIEPTAVFTVLLTITGLIVGTLSDTVMARGFAAFFISSAVVLAVVAFVQMFPLLFFEGAPPSPLMITALGQTVYSLLFTLPLSLFVRALGKRRAAYP